MTTEWKIIKVQDGKMKELSYSDMVDEVRKSEMKAIHQDLSDLRNQTDKIFQRYFGEGEIRADISLSAAIRQLCNAKTSFDTDSLMKELLPTYEKDYGYKAVQVAIYQQTKKLEGDGILRKVSRGHWENIVNKTREMNKEITQQ